MSESVAALVQAVERHSISDRQKLELLLTSLDGVPGAIRSMVALGDFDAETKRLGKAVADNIDAVVSLVTRPER